MDNKQVIVGLIAATAGLFIVSGSAFAKGIVVGKVGTLGGGGVRLSGIYNNGNEFSLGCKT
ncbi:MAG: hypothetical protein CSB47_06540 [Proteobacteria bacterium]|nr:MAG: hypothetical protein CSB47_06540 [Pseudomonadota bacterium]